MQASHLLLVLACATCCAHAELPRPEYASIARRSRAAHAADQRLLSLLDIRGDTVLRCGLPDDSVTAIVFVSGYSCFECFGMLDRCLALQLERDMPLRIVAVSRGTQSAIARRGRIESMQRLVPHAAWTLFDVNAWAREDPWPPVRLTDGMFGEYSVSKCPALLIVDGERRRMFACEELFGGEETNCGIIETALWESASQRTR